MDSDTFMFLKKIKEIQIGRDVPSCSENWTWWQLADHSPFRVEQCTFPKTNSGHTLTGPTPCTDGETLWVPSSGFPSSVSFLFHEMAHALLHYPNGPDPDLLDPLPRHESVWEFEACLAATQIIKKLELTDTYNQWYMRTWRGEFGDLRLKMVAEAVDYVVRHYQEALIERRRRASY